MSSDRPLDSAPSAIICPCCGTALASTPWVWDRASGTLLTQEGASKHLNSHEVNLLDALIAKRGAILSYAAGVTALYGHCREPSAPEEVLKVVTCTLRKAIKPTGVRIVTEYARGYRIVLPSSRPSFREAAE